MKDAFLLLFSAPFLFCCFSHHLFPSRVPAHLRWWGSGQHFLLFCFFVFFLRRSVEEVSILSSCLSFFLTLLVSRSPLSLTLLTTSLWVQPTWLWAKINAHMCLQLLYTGLMKVKERKIDKLNLQAQKESCWLAAKYSLKCVFFFSVILHR